MESSATALTLAIELLQILPALVQMTQEVEALVTGTVTSLQDMQAENRDPTSAEWDALHKTIADLQAQLNG